MSQLNLTTKALLKKIHHFHDDIYRENFYLCRGWDAADYARYIKEYFGVTKNTASILGHTIDWRGDDGGHIIVIWVKDMKDYPTMAHECLHAANICLHRIGWVPQLDNDEPQTYLLAALMREMLS